MTNMNKMKQLAKITANNIINGSTTFTLVVLEISRMQSRVEAAYVAIEIDRVLQDSGWQEHSEDLSKALLDALTI